MGGTIHKDIVKGEGTTGDVGIGGEILLQEGTKINQHNLLVANMPDDGIVGSLTANASDITLSGTLTNDNELTFTGGQNANAIAGTGNVMIGGDATNVEVTNLAGTQIANTVAITQGNHLLAQAGDLTKTVSNAGQLTLSGTDVTNVAQITGNGELVIDGTITNTDEKRLRTPSPLTLIRVYRPTQPTC